MAPQPAAADLAVQVPEELQLGQYIPLHYHYHMLQDEDRVAGFQAAIAQEVAPGMHVVELGAGTGILSSFAARRGATVSCIERIPALAAAAEKFLLDNGLGDRAQVICADASRFVPAQPVDVVICEMLHVALLREKQLLVIDAFKSNYRRAFGDSVPLPRFIPEASILMWQPVYQCFDFAGYWAPIPMFQAPLLQNARTTELGPLDPYASISYESDYPLRFTCQQAVPAAVAGTVNAVRFVTQNVMAIDVPNQSAITWPNQCLILPISEPFDVLAGQHLQISFDYAGGAPLETLAASMELQVQ